MGKDAYLISLRKKGGANGRRGRKEALTAFMTGGGLSRVKRTSDWSTGIIKLRGGEERLDRIF